MRRIFISIVAVMSLCSVIILASCVDSKYDLSKDIDLTVSIGGSEFAIPGGETEMVKLSDILNIEENQIIETDTEGNYRIFIEGEKFDQDVHIQGFSINSPAIPPIEKNINLTSVLPMPSRSITGSGKLIATIPGGEYTASFKFEEDNIPADIKSISRIDADMDISFSFAFSEGLAKKFYMENMQIELPKYFISDKLVDGVMDIKDVVVMDGDKYSVNIPIKGIDLSKMPEGEGLNGKTHTLLINGEVSISGELSLYIDDLTIRDLPTSLGFNTNISLGNASVGSVTGVVSPKLDFDIPPFKLDNVPDFFNGGDVVLDLSNPMIFFDIDNEIPVEATISGVIKSFKNGVQIADDVNFKIPDIKSSGSQKFCISPKGSGESGVTDIIIHELSSIVYRIPDEIVFTAKVDTGDKEMEIKLENNYSFSANYKIDIPMTFGPKMSIVYNETIGGWGADLEDYGFSKINLAATLFNSIPLNLSLRATPVDKNGDIIEGISVKIMADGTEDGTIKSGSVANISETEIVVQIIETVAGSINRLDGIALSATAKAAQDGEVCQLNANQGVQLKRVKLKIPGGITADLNSTEK